MGKKISLYFISYWLMDAMSEILDVSLKYFFSLRYIEVASYLIHEIPIDW